MQLSDQSEVKVVGIKRCKSAIDDAAAAAAAIHLDLDLQTSNESTQIINGSVHTSVTLDNNVTLTVSQMRRERGTAAARWLIEATHIGRFCKVAREIQQWTEIEIGCPVFSGIHRIKDFRPDALIPLLNLQYADEQKRLKLILEKDDEIISCYYVDIEMQSSFPIQDN